MLYVVEMDFTRPARQAEWDAWYLEHLQLLLAVPGFHSAQRFVCTVECPAPYLAIYSVDAPDVFDSAAYRARGGRDSVGDWKPLMVNWDRNVYAGIERMPAVNGDQVVLLTEAAPAEVAGWSIPFTWLEAVGLDRTIARRGLAIAAAQHGREIVNGRRAHVRAYRPMTQQLLAAGDRDAGTLRA